MNAIKFLLRLSPELHAKIKERAESEGRSLHNLIIHLLTQSLK
jgi:predicted HicB family RNase H-like nuclease